MNVLGAHLTEAEEVFEQVGVPLEGVRAGLVRGRVGHLLVELDGDPVTRVTLVVPPSERAGELLVRVTRLIEGNAERALVLAAGARVALADWAKDVGAPLDVLVVGTEVSLRLQSLTGNLVVMSWSPT